MIYRRRRRPLRRPPPLTQPATHATLEEGSTFTVRLSHAKSSSRSSLRLRLHLSPSPAPLACALLPRSHLRYWPLRPQREKTRYITRSREGSPSRKLSALAANSPPHPITHPKSCLASERPVSRFVTRHDVWSNINHVFTPDEDDEARKTVREG